jgi:multidrug resistance protein, MATE family
MAVATSSSPFRTELGTTLRLAAPLALANLMQMAIYATDVVFIAQLGEQPLAAASLATALFGQMVWTFSGLTGAVAPLVAAELGRRQHAVREVRRSLRMALWLAAFCAVFGLVVCQFGTKIMLATGQQPGVAQDAGLFLSILGWSMFPQIGANVLRIFVSALGRPVFASVIMGIAIAVNAIGNYVLIFGNFGMPAMGLAGSATATLITSIVTFLAYCVAIRLDKRMRRYRLFGRWWRTEWSRFREILRVGLPIGLIVLAEGGLFNAATFLMGLIGPAQLAGHALAFQIAALAFQVPFGVGQAATIRVGFHYGARDPAAIGRAGWAALIIGLAFGVIAAAAMLLFPLTLLSAYVVIGDPKNAAMLAFAQQFILIAAAFHLFDGVQTVASGVLRGLQDTQMPMVLALLGYWLVGGVAAVGLGFATPLAGLGIWIGLAIGLVVVATLLLWRWYRREQLGLDQAARA